MLCVTQTLAQKYVVPVTKDDIVAYIKLSPDVQWKKEVLGLILSMYHEKEAKTAINSISLCQCAGALKS